MAWNNRKYWNFDALEENNDGETLKFGKKSHRTKKSVKKSHRTKKSASKSRHMNKSRRTKSVKKSRTKKSAKKSRRTTRRSKTHHGKHHEFRRLVLA